MHDLVSYYNNKRAFHKSCMRLAEINNLVLQKVYENSLKTIVEHTWSLSLKKADETGKWG